MHLGNFPAVQAVHLRQFSKGYPQASNIDQEHSVPAHDLALVATCRAKASKKREKECFRKSCVVPTVFLQAAGPVLILLVLILVNPWGIGGYGSIMLLILPDLAEVFLYNQTHQRDDPMTVGNETTLSREQEVMSRWQQGSWAEKQLVLERFVRRALRQLEIAQMQRSISQQSLVNRFCSILDSWLSQAIYSRFLQTTLLHIQSCMV